MAGLPTTKAALFTGVSTRRRLAFPLLAVAFAVGGYIAAAYWFTSSTSFANPAVTIARMLGPG